MPSDDNRHVSRRRFVQVAGASGAVGLAGCSGGGGSGDGGSGDGGSGDGSSGDGSSGDGGSDGQDGDTSGSSSDETITLQFATSINQQEWVEQLPSIFEKHGLADNIELDLNNSAFQQTGKVGEQFAQWLSAGRAKPDLLQIDYSWGIGLVARDLLQNLNEVMSSSVLSEVEDNYVRDHVNSMRHPTNDSLYGVPLWLGVPTMQYRKDLVEEAGYDPEGENWATESITWQKFSRVTRDVLDQNDIKFGYTFQANAYEGLSCCDFNEWLTSFGGAFFGNPDEYLFGPVGDRPITVDEQQVIDSLRMIRTFIYGSDDSVALDGYAGNIAPRDVVGWVEESSRKPFTNGDAVMHRNWPYAVNLNADAFGEDLGVMPIPYAVTPDEAKYPRTGGPVASLGGWHASINPNSEHVEEAARVIEITTKPEFQVDFFELTGFNTANPDVMLRDAAREVDVLGNYVDTFAVGARNVMSRPASVVWETQSTRIAQEANSALKQEKTPTKAMTDLKEQLRQIENSA